MPGLTCTHCGEAILNPLQLRNHLAREHGIDLRSVAEAVSDHSSRQDTEAQ